MSIEFVAWLVPILLGTVALILGLLLVFQVRQQQEKRSLGKRVSANKYKVKSNADSANFLGVKVIFALNGIANIIAFVLMQSGTPRDQAYVVSYCVVFPIGTLLIQSATIEQGDNISTPQTDKPISTPKSLRLGNLDFSQPHPLKTRLLAMVGGHHPTASRLLAQAVREYPGRSIEWYYDKVINDLIRDRR